MKRIIFLLLGAAAVTAAVVFFTRPSEQSDVDAWLKSTNVDVAVDQTLQPIMAEELQQFGLTYPVAEVFPVYCSEQEAIERILKDSVQIAVTTRPLNKKEKAYLKSRQKGIRQSKFAYDSFALIVNKSNKDTLISVEQIRDIVTGKIKTWKELNPKSENHKLSLVFDHSGSSTVRFIRDSICGGAEMKGNLFAQGTNRAVIKAVEDNPYAIGVVGTDWLRNDKEQALSSFKDLGVNVMLVTDSKESFPLYYRPYQYRIGTGEYPLIRSVWVITTDPRKRSNVKNLYYWLKGERGQKIICNNSQLLPNVPVQVRNIHITD